MLYTQVLEILPGKLASDLSNLVDEKLFTSNQVVRILNQSFNINKKSSNYEIRSAVHILILAINLIKSNKVKENDYPMYEKTIKRLMKKNGNETINEFICHIGLSGSFTNYYINPLFENMPDGFIKDENLNIDVEIKSRFPEVFSQIADFYDQFRKMLSVHHEGLNIISHIHLNSFKTLDRDFCKKEALIYEDYVKEIKLDLSREYSHSIEVGRSSENIEYTITFSVEKSTDKQYFGYPNENLKNTFIDSCYTKVTKNGMFSGSQHIPLTLSDTLKNYLSKKLIKECLHSISNLPAEPRVVAIYLIDNPYLTEFVEKFIDEYICVNKGTAILGITSGFHGEDDFRINLPYYSFGSDIKEVLSKHFFKPIL